MDESRDPVGALPCEGHEHDPTCPLPATVDHLHLLELTWMGQAARPFLVWLVSLGVMTQRPSHIVAVLHSKGILLTRESTLFLFAQNLECI